MDSVGWAYYRLGRYDDAAQTLEAAVLLVPGDPTINNHLGDALWKVGRKIEARFQWNHALTFRPEDEREGRRSRQKLKSRIRPGDRSRSGRKRRPSRGTRAKINLFLHVGDRRADGFHPLQSLAVFAEAATG